MNNNNKYNIQSLTKREKKRKIELNLEEKEEKKMRKIMIQDQRLELSFSPRSNKIYRSIKNAN